MKIRQAVYDVLRRLGQTSDDEAILFRQALQWIDTARIKLFRDYLRQEGEIPPGVVRRFDCVPVLRKEVPCENCYSYIIELPASVIDLEGDMGVYQVLRPGGKSITRLGSSGKASILKNNKFFVEGWYRIDDNIHLIGKRFYDGTKLHLELIPESSLPFAYDEQLPAPSFQLADILDEAEKIGARMIGRPPDVTNDGKGVPNR